MRFKSPPLSFDCARAVALASALLAISGCSGGGAAFQPPLTPTTPRSLDKTQSTARSTSIKTSSSYYSAVTASAPLVYYPMGETSGSTAVDASGNAHNATYSASFRLKQPSLLASDSTGSSVSFPAGYASENVTWTKQSVSAECWIKPSSSDITYHPRILSNAWTDSTGNGFMLWLNGGRASFQTGWYSANTPTQLLANATYHLVGTFDPTSGTTLYVNGAAVANVMPGVGSGPPVPTPQTGDGTASYIGALKTSGGFSDYFQGDISNCAVYDHALSAAEVANHYRAGGQTVTAAPAPTATATSAYETTVKTNSPLGFYRMSEASGTTAIDASGNNNNATYIASVQLNRPALLASDPTRTSANFSSGGFASENVTWTNQAVTAECWIKPSSNDLLYHPRLVSNAWTDSTGNGFMLWINGGKAAFQTGWYSAAATTPFVAGNTYHIVGTFDVAGGTTLYVNGTSVAHTMPGVGSGPPVPTPQTGDSATSYIGVLKTPGGLSDYFQGDISNCALYDHALTASDVANHYKAGIQGSTTVAPTASPTNTPASGGTSAPTAAPTVAPTAAPTAAPTTSSSTAIVTNPINACINHALYTNNVLPAGVGEFASNGLDRNFWGGVKTRTQPVGGNPGGSWGPGFLTSWGRHQYDTYFSDASDGLNLDPFYVGPDTGAPGSPNALRISAMPLPSNVAHSLTVLQNDQYPVTATSTSFQVPSEGSSLVVNVANPGSAQNNFTVGMGYQGAGVMFVGTLTSGGNAPSTNGGASNPWTISNIHVYTGTPGTTIVPGQNDEGGLRSYFFPQYISGTLDTNINQEYGYFVSRMRLPNYLPGLSPAFWTLETGGVPDPSTGLQRNELDIEEMFANTEGNALNQNEIHWNTTDTAGVGVTAFPSGTPQSDYHDYGVLQTPLGTSFYIDGKPTPGDVNLPDWTSGSPDKELMLMFQIAAPGTFLDGNGTAMNNPWPQYVWSQWIRAYAPSTTSC